MFQQVAMTASSCALIPALTTAQPTQIDRTTLELQVYTATGTKNSAWFPAGNSTTITKNK